MQSVFCLAARRTKLTGRVPMFGAAPVSKKRIGLNRAPEPVMGIVWRSLPIGTAANWCELVRRMHADAGSDGTGRCSDALALD